MAHYTLLFFLIVCTLFSSCHNQKTKVVIEGDLHHGGNRMIRLARIEDAGLVMLDSCYMQNGHFEFNVVARTPEEGTILALPMLYQLIVNQDNSITTMAQSNEHLSVVADADNMIRSYHVLGGEEAMLMVTLDSALTVFILQTDSLWTCYQQAMENDSLRVRVEQDYNVLVEHHTAFLRQFIQAHPSNMASYIAFYQRYNRKKFFDEEKDFELLEALTDRLSQQYPDHPYMIRMQQKVENIKNLKYDTD